MLLGLRFKIRLKFTSSGTESDKLASHVLLTISDKVQAEPKASGLFETNLEHPGVERGHLRKSRVNGLQWRLVWILFNICRSRIVKPGDEVWRFQSFGQSRWLHPAVGRSATRLATRRATGEGNIRSGFWRENFGYINEVFHLKRWVAFPLLPLPLLVG